MHNKTTIDRDILNIIIKDRLDFGFDSIYFRYAAARDELATLKAMYESHDLEKEQRRANVDKEHFWKTLEQYIRAHEREEEVNLDIDK